MNAKGLFTAILVTGLGWNATALGEKGAKGAKPAGQVVEVSVTEKGFEPAQIEVAPGTPLTLKITRKTKATCAEHITVPDMNVKKELPLNETVTVELGRLVKGDVKFGCAMNQMIGGMIHVK